MNKLLAAVVAATFALTCTAGFAKTEEMTKEQRADLHARADKLIADRAATANQVKANVKPAATVKKHHAKKVKKVTQPAVKKAQPKT